MGSVSLPLLSGAYNVKDFGARGNSLGDDGPAFNRAAAEIASNPTAYGQLVIPPGTYRIVTPIDWRSNLMLTGYGIASTLILASTSVEDVLRCQNLSNVYLANFRIDGNRANTTGTRNGLYLSGCSDVRIDGVEVVSCRMDGFRLENCDRVEFTTCKASDNGRHGFSLSWARFCQMLAPRSYDNCQVSSVGVGDGINLENFSQHNTIIAPVCYETALTGDRQGYGVRETDSSQLNQIIGGICQGNRTAPVLIGGRDSVWITQAAAQTATLTQYVP